MEAVPAGDWEFEEANDEAEPYEAEAFEEGYEPEDLEYDEAEFEPGAGPVMMTYRTRDQRGRPRSYAVAVKGVQTAVVNTPAGNAKIQLPSKVPTLGEFRSTLDKVQRDMATTNQRVSSLSNELRRARRRAARAERASTAAARNGLILVALDQVKDVLREVAELKLMSSIAG